MLDAIVDQWFADRIRNSAVTRAGTAAVACITEAINDADGLKARLRAAAGEPTTTAPATGGEEGED